MSAKQTQPGSLSQVQGRIAGLLSDLNATVEEVQELTNLGDNRRALRLLEEQRGAMYQLVDQISREVSASGPSRWAQLSRHMSAAAVAAIFAIGAVAMSITALTRPSDPLSDATVQLRKAAAISDPEVRLQVIVKVYESTRALPRGTTTALDRTLAAQARKTADELEGDNADPTLTDRASQIATDLSEGKPPSPPPAPSGDSPPTDAVDGVVPSP